MIFSHIVDRDNVRMGKQPDGFSLSAKPLDDGLMGHSISPEDFQCNISTDLGIVSEIDHAHGTPAQFSDYLVAAILHEY